MRTRRGWTRRSWTQPKGDERLKLAALREAVTEWLATDGDAGELEQILRLTVPDPGTAGAAITDEQRGVTYRVTLDTTRPGDPRLRSVEIVRDQVSKGLHGYTLKCGELRRKGKPGTYLAPYDESVFRVPVQELVAQTLAVLAHEDRLRERGVRGIVVGARQLAPPTPEELRQHLRDGMTPKTIAERYERGTRMVYGWIATAREATPELDWPEVKHGPKKTTDGDRPSGITTKENDEHESTERPTRRRGERSGRPAHQ